MAGELDRPAVLTPDVQRAIVEFLAEGNYLSVACEAAGISVRTFYYWQRLFEAKAEHAQKYADFFHAVKRALAHGEVSAVGRVRRGGEGWQGSAWFLERRYRKRWARQPTVIVQSQIASREAPIENGDEPATDPIAGPPPGAAEGPG